jgi:N-glycosylase/DNA lyase
MEDIKQLKKLYKLKKKEIISRIKEFEKININNKEKIFSELCFCILTPQSKAKKCWDAIINLNKKNLLSKGTYNEIQDCLKGNVRFHKNKTVYIINAQKYISEIKNILNNSKDSCLLREYIVKNIKGLGYKEASHFLRNIGLGQNLAILDRHILKNLLKYKVISNIPKTLTKKNYLNIEKEMLSFSNKIDIPMEHLDLLFWSIQTGEVFK